MSAQFIIHAEKCCIWKAKGGEKTCCRPELAADVIGDVKAQDFEEWHEAISKNATNLLTLSQVLV